MMTFPFNQHRQLFFCFLLFFSIFVISVQSLSIVERAKDKRKLFVLFFFFFKSKYLFINLHVFTSLTIKYYNTILNGQGKKGIEIKSDPKVYQANANLALFGYEYDITTPKKIQQVGIASIQPVNTDIFN